MSASKYGATDSFPGDNDIADPGTADGGIHDFSAHGDGAVDNSGGIGGQTGEIAVPGDDPDRAVRQGDNDAVIHCGTGSMEQDAEKLVIFGIDIYFALQMVSGGRGNNARNGGVVKVQRHIQHTGGFGIADGVVEITYQFDVFEVRNTSSTTA